MKQPMPVSSGRNRSNWNYSTTGSGSLVFHPKPIISALHILKCSSRYIVTVCIQLSAVKTFFFFLTQKSGFCPSFPKARWWPTDSCWQKGQRFPLLPPCPDVIRPRTGDPSAAQKAQWEGSLLWTQLHDGHHTDTEQLVTSGWTLGWPSWFSCHCWLWSWCPGKSWAQEREAGSQQRG